MRGSARRTAMPHSKPQDQPARKRRTAAQAAPRFQAVIFLGASAVSMMVAETTASGNRVVDVLSQPVNLAQDVFNGGIVTRETMDRCVQIAQGYTTLLDEYRKAGEMQVRLLATNILLDVHNMDTLVNRLQISCGLELEVMDDGEMTRLLYLSMQEVLEHDAELQGQRVLVLHVGPGNTRLLLFDKGRISYYASYRMGAHRTGISIARQDSDTADECSRIREHIRGNLEQIFYDIEPVLQEPPDALVVFGPDFHRLQSPLAGGTVTEESLERLADEIAETPASQRMERYREDYAAMPAVLPTVVICLSIIRGLEPARIICPGDASSQLAFLANLCWLTFGINNNNITVITMNTNWKWLIIIKFTINNIICANISCFGWTIKISISNAVIKIVNPVVKLFCRHYLASKKNCFNILWLCNLE